MTISVKFPLLDSSIQLSGATILVIENRFVFSSVVQSFYQYQGESSLMLFDKNLKDIKSTELILVTDVLNYDVNAVSILKLVHSDLERHLNEKPHIKMEIEKLCNSITDIISYECIDMELNLEYDEITIMDLIKALGVQIEVKSVTIFEKCLEIVQVCKYLIKKRLLVFFNVCAYLTEKEIKSLIEYIELLNMTVLFIEPRKVFQLPQYVLDEDYITMFENMV